MSETEEKELGGQDLDITKIVSITVKSIVWIFLMLIISNVGGYLYLRWTPKVYQSASLLKIKQKNEGSVIGIDQFSNGSSYALEGEIELIKSNIIYNKVIKELNLFTSYHRQGNILDEELFQNSPFILDTYKILNRSILNKKIDFKILNKDEYQINIKQGEIDNIFVHKFNKIESNPFLDLKISFLGDAEVNKESDFYFTIHTEGSLRSYLASNLRVQANNQTNTLYIIFKDKTAKKAQAIVNAINKAYLWHTLETKKQINQQTITYLEKQIKERGELLQNSMNETQDFSTKNMTVNVKGDFINSIKKINTVEDEILKQKYQLKAFKRVGTLVKANKIEEAIRYLDIFELNGFSDELKEYTDADESQRKYEFTSTENTLAYKMRQGDNEGVLESLESEIDKTIERANLKILNLNEIKTESYQKLFLLPEKIIESDQINRNSSLNQSFYMMFYRKKMEFEIAQAGIVPEFKILAAASLSHAPISPVPTLIYLYCSVIALAFGLVLIVIRYLLHNTVTNQNDIERLTRVPVSGIVPKYSKTKMEVSQLVVDKNPKSMVGEAFRTIRTNLEFISPFKGKILSVTSTISGEGKTFVSINLAASIAQSGLKTVLLDLDMRKPKIHLAFGHDNTKGMSTILSKKTSIKECILPTPVEGYDFIPAGPIPPNPSELIIRGEEFDRTIQELKKGYDVIMVDTPPTGLVTDGVLIMRKVDLPLYVVRSEYTKFGFEKNVNKLFGKNDFKNLSIIINSVANGVDTYGSGYGYYDDDEPISFLDKIFKRN